MQESWVQSLGWEDPLQKEMAPHSSIRAWIIPWTEEPGVLQSMGSQRVGHDLASQQWQQKHRISYYQRRRAQFQKHKDQYVRYARLKAFISVMEKLTEGKTD